MKHILSSSLTVSKWFYRLLFLFLVIIDQVIKKIFLNVDNQFGFIRLHAVENFGLVFSLNFNQAFNSILLIFALIFFCWQLYKSYFQKNTFLTISYVLIVSGAVSNLFDRIFFGRVFDFINLGSGFTFNFADVYIFIGIILLLFSSRINSKTK